MILSQDRGLGQDQGKSGLKAVTLGQEPREACDYSYLHYKDLQEKNELNYSFFKIQYFFLHLSVTNRYKTQYSQHFHKYSTNSPRYLKFSITYSFCWKCEAWLSIVAKIAELNLALSSELCVFGLFWAFLTKKRSQTSHFPQKHRVKLIVVSENAEQNCAL